MLTCAADGRWRRVHLDARGHPSSVAGVAATEPGAVARERAPANRRLRCPWLDLRSYVLRLPAVPPLALTTGDAVDGLSIPFFTIGKRVSSRTISLRHTLSMRAVPEWLSSTRRMDGASAPDGDSTGTGNGDIELGARDESAHSIASGAPGAGPDTPKTPVLKGLHVATPVVGPFIFLATEPAAHFAVQRRRTTVRARPRACISWTTSRRCAHACACASTVTRSVSSRARARRPAPRARQYFGRPEPTPARVVQECPCQRCVWPPDRVIRPLKRARSPTAARAHLLACASRTTAWTSPRVCARGSRRTCVAGARAQASPTPARRRPRALDLQNVVWTARRRRRVRGPRRRSAGPARNNTGSVAVALCG
jgi:hypothetical protein